MATGPAATDVTSVDAGAVESTRARTLRGPNVLQRWLDRYMLIIYTILAVIYLMLPVALIILFSFNNPAGKSNTVWQGFTFKYWLNPLGVDGLPQAISLSLVIAFASTIIATVLGDAHRPRPRPVRLPGRRFTNSLIFLPMATPEIILGASLLTLFVSIGNDPFFPLSGFTILIAHIMFNISFVVVTVRAGSRASRATSRKRRWTCTRTSSRRSGRSRSR